MTKMGQIQERALRFVHGDYTSDYNGLLSISKLPSLKLGRCELNEIDDEIHLLLHCSPMNNVREILFDSVAAIINIQPTNEMFLRIMTSIET